MVGHMWEGSYGREPFDLRLTVLRMMRNLKIVICITLAGTLLFGGGYYVKNVVLEPEPNYTATSTYKVSYVVDPNVAGAYFINETSWNTFIHSKEFLDAVQQHISKLGTEQGIECPELTNEELANMLSATLASDLRVPATTVTTQSGELSIAIAAAVELAMTNEFVAGATAEIDSIRVIDPALTAKETLSQARPARAFILSAVLSCFFALLLTLLKELGEDGIYLPATLRRRYGLKVIGTINSRDCKENMRYLFGGKHHNIICTVDDRVDPAQVLEKLRNMDALPGGDTRQEGDNPSAQNTVWTVAPSPLLCPESCRALRQADGILLAVRAGSHAGKPLEYVMEYMKQQDCDITAVILWDADEALIKQYYGLAAL